ncbi:MAG: 50S ribosomal protein L9 [Candidatus Aminicenantes bacterium RBG_19FT_COMBO_65_30]|nr:MAG: 50S ribosomal protein L9 [Candidatus Aminicenantes bacterium RBG_19FT_COMBO_65_30]
MKVILKQDVEKVGRRGDVVNVAPGFGRNYLIPRKMAIAVTPTNIKMIEIERQALKKKLEIERKSFQSLAQKLNQVSLTFTRRAGEKDVIFGSVSAGDVKDALDGLGYDIDKKKILLDEPIKRLGNFSVPIKISADDRAEVKIVVTREEAEGTDVGIAGEKTEDQAAGKT